MVEQNLVFKSCCCSNKNIFLPEKFKALQNQLNISIEESKEKYYTKLSSRLADPVASPKKGNNYRNENNQSLKNYRPISLLPICSKSFDRLIYNEIFTFFTENNLISPNQSGFRPGNSCINQLLTITHEIQHNTCLAINDTIRGTSTEKKYTKNQAQNLLNLGVGLENFFIFIRYSRKNPSRIYLT